MTEPAYEVNFDGLIGPTHNYAGLSYGNTASLAHAQATSSPKLATLEGLAKMKLMMDLGIKQAVLPPHERPNIHALKQLGFNGNDAAVLEKANHESPVLLAAACSASSMWTANAATISPSTDTADGRVHFTPANLISQPHRAIEPAATAAILKTIFADESCFAHHAPLPPGVHLGDEGAANHTRLSSSYNTPGVELFVYGRVALNPNAPSPQCFPARQTHEASTAIARLHQLNPQQTVFAQQNPAVIDAGVFHNDVIAVGNLNVLLYHSEAFVDTPNVINTLQERYPKTSGGGGELVCIEDHLLTRSPSPTR